MSFEQFPACQGKGFMGEYCNGNPSQTPTFTRPLTQNSLDMDPETHRPQPATKSCNV